MKYHEILLEVYVDGPHILGLESRYVNWWKDLAGV